MIYNFMDFICVLFILVLSLCLEIIKFILIILTTVTLCYLIHSMFISSKIKKMCSITMSISYPDLFINLSCSAIPKIHVNKFYSYLYFVSLRNLHRLIFQWNTLGYLSGVIKASPSARETSRSSLVGCGLKRRNQILYDQFNLQSVISGHVI